MNPIICHIVVAILLTVPTLASAGLIQPGDLAFIGFNADGNDDFAIVLLADADAGTIVRLSDREWTGSGFNTGEGAVNWTLTQALTAGTVVSFSNVDNAANSGFGPSSGTLSGALQLAVGGETIYAFLGTSTTSPTTFLAAISNLASDYSGSSNTLNGTGLIQGSTAVLLPSGTRGGVYSGTRFQSGGFQEFVPLIGDTSQNWTVSTSNGLDVLPFNMEPLATPEPATSSIALMAALALAAAKWRHIRKERFHHREHGEHRDA
jgi:hypothetical protein